MFYPQQQLTTHLHPVTNLLLLAGMNAYTELYSTCFGVGVLSAVPACLHLLSGVANIAAMQSEGGLAVM